MTDADTMKLDVPFQTWWNPNWARIVLESGTGATNREVAAGLRTTNATVGKWRSRFIERGPAGLLDAIAPSSQGMEWYAPRFVESDNGNVMLLRL